MSRPSERVHHMRTIVTRRKTQRRSCGSNLRMRPERDDTETRGLRGLGKVDVRGFLKQYLANICRSPRDEKKAHATCVVARNMCTCATCVVVHSARTCAHGARNIYTCVCTCMGLAMGLAMNHHIYAACVVARSIFTCENYARVKVSRIVQMLDATCPLAKYNM